MAAGAAWQQVHRQIQGDMKPVLRPTAEERKIMRAMGYKSVEELDEAMTGDPDPNALAQMDPDPDEPIAEDDSDNGGEFGGRDMLVLSDLAQRLNELDALAEKLKIQRPVRQGPLSREEREKERFELMKLEACEWLRGELVRQLHEPERQERERRKRVELWRNDVSEDEKAATLKIENELRRWKWNNGFDPDAAQLRIRAKKALGKRLTSSETQMLGLLARRQCSTERIERSARMNAVPEYGRWRGHARVPPGWILPHADLLFSELCDAFFDALKHGSENRATNLLLEVMRLTRDEQLADPRDPEVAHNEALDKFRDLLEAEDRDEQGQNGSPGVLPAKTRQD